MMTRTVCFKQKIYICYAKFGNLGPNGAEVKIIRRKCHIWNLWPWFAYFLCNFDEATMML